MFSIIDKMTKYELGQQNSGTLIDHILEIKKKLKTGYIGFKYPCDNDKNNHIVYTLCEYRPEEKYDNEGINNSIHQVLIKLSRLTNHKLQQQNIPTLIKHILVFKNVLEIIFGDIKCHCIPNSLHYHETCDSCKRTLCSKELRYEGIYRNQIHETPRICNECSVTCPYFKFCGTNTISKHNVQRYYPNWNVSGCRFHTTDLFHKDGNTKFVCHCIYPINEKDNTAILSLLCGASSRRARPCGRPCSNQIGNICDIHMTDFNVFFENVLSIILPKVLISICFEYFYLDPNECKEDLETYPNCKYYRNYDDYYDHKSPERKIYNYLDKFKDSDNSDNSDRSDDSED
jgi:hypothetical protein